MRLRRSAQIAAASLALLGVAACNPTTMTLAGDRAATRDIAFKLVSELDPVIEPAPVAQCIGASATPDEADALIAADQSGDRDAAQAALTKILRKTNTQECLSSVGVPDFV